MLLEGVTLKAAHSRPAIAACHACTRACIRVEPAAVIDSSEERAPQIWQIEGTASIPGSAGGTNDRKQTRVGRSAYLRTITKQPARWRCSSEIWHHGSGGDDRI